MSNSVDSERRKFLSALGLAAAGSLTPAGSAPGRAGEFSSRVDDARRELQPLGADLGTLYPDLEKLAEGDTYSLSFLGSRFRELDEFKAAARQKVFELFLYKPAKVEHRAEVVERSEQSDHIREKIVFSTGPHFRVPAYVLIPKDLKKPAPAIVDLHSHGGMFLFGKEKVIDLDANHPAMTIYHERNYEGRPTATALVRRGYVVITIDAFYFWRARQLLYGCRTWPTDGSGQNTRSKKKPGS